VGLGFNLQPVIDVRQAGNPPALLWSERGEE
jgi:hypothetical protein